ncbi:MAG TPA: LysR family transcriptional regulator [Mycobacterium sp.]|nr:LysR family transcriptional regulator [Mycobacterium sp.]
MAKKLNFRRAAEKLFITQPALSTAIKALEHQTGATLLRRNTRGVALTDVGAAFLPVAVEV